MFIVYQMIERITPPSTRSAAPLVAGIERSSVEKEQIIACLSRGRSRMDGGLRLTECSPEKNDDSGYFKARVLTGNPEARAPSSLRCLFFLRHRVLQHQSLVFWLRLHTLHILSYRLHHYGRGKRLLPVRGIARTSLPISLIAGHNGCRVFSCAESSSAVTAHGLEEGESPPLVPFVTHSRIPSANDAALLAFGFGPDPCQPGSRYTARRSRSRRPCLSSSAAVDYRPKCSGGSPGTSRDSKCFR